MHVDRCALYERLDMYRAVLASDLDGSFKAMAVTLPSNTELVDKVDEADPVLCYEVTLRPVPYVMFDQNVCKLLLCSSMCSEDAGEHVLVMQQWVQQHLSQSHT